MPNHSNLSRLVVVMYMLNIVGSFTICIQPIYAIFEKQEPVKKEKEESDDPEESHLTDMSIAERVEQQTGQTLGFYVRRLSIPFVIMLMSTLFPDVNTILSLVAGSICGVLLIVLPVFFYRAAYIDKPSKKNRGCTIAAGYLLVALTLPLGIIGVYTNIKHMIALDEAETATPSE